MDKPVYTVSTASLYEHPSLELATADYDVARARFEVLASDNDWQTIIFEEWYNGVATTIDIERR